MALDTTLTTIPPPVERSAPAQSTASPVALVKSVARGVAHVLAAPLVLWYWLWVPLWAAIVPCRGRPNSSSLFPGITGQYLRRAFLTWTIEACHPTATVCFGTTFSKAQARLGANVYVGPSCHLGMVDLEDGCAPGRGRPHPQRRPHARIRRPEPADSRTGGRASPDSHRRPFLDWQRGGHPGRRRGRCDHRRGAVVTRPIPDGVIAAGVPAQVIKQRVPAQENTTASNSAPRPARRRAGRR